MRCCEHGEGFGSYPGDFSAMIKTPMAGPQWPLHVFTRDAGVLFIDQELMACLGMFRKPFSWPSFPSHLQRMI